VNLHAKSDVEAFCRNNLFLHIYALGDLDDFFWPYTTWYALRHEGRIQQIVLLYSGCSLPTVLAYGEQPLRSLCDLLRGLLPFLPRRFYAHLMQDGAEALENDYHVTRHGAYHKMALTDFARLAAVEGSEAVRLSAADRGDLEALYAAAYPGNFFTPRMLETGYYFGVRRGGALVSVAGVHVYSPQYKVAALGNITTRPDFRGHGLATAATARLCQELRGAGIEHIGLNVKADNQAGLRCYQKIGFERVADYGEYTMNAQESVAPALI
jgi:ribosomal protein S18 acetylase RimI-like enzyme